MPTHEQLQEVLTALVGNGLDFFVRSAQELEKHQKFSIAHFATGLELLLKARLFHEHWSLIATDPHSCAWTSVKDGTVRTLQASDLCAAITTTTGTPLNREKTAFEGVFKHRNRVLHWAPNDDLTATVAEQCLAWHHLRALLTGTWSDTFHQFSSRIEDVERQLRAHRSYLEVRFAQYEDMLKGFERAKRLFTCSVCRFRAGMVEDRALRVLSSECRVCGFAESVARFPCGAFVPLDELPVAECACGESHSRDELIEELDPSDPKEDPDRAYCGECFDIEATVVTDGDGYVCVACGSRFAPGDSTVCGWCNERWFGWDSEGSSLTGCERCDGRGTDRD